MPMMTIAPKIAIYSDPPASTAFCPGPTVCLLVAMKNPSQDRTGGFETAAVLRANVCSVARGQETGLFHPDLVALFLLFDQLGIVCPGPEGGVERASLHERLPVGRSADCLEEFDVKFDLVLGGLGRHEHAAQHQILHV